MFFGILVVFLLGGVTGAVVTTEYPQVQEVIKKENAKYEDWSKDQPETPAPKH